MDYFCMSRTKVLNVPGIIYAPLPCVNEQRQDVSQRPAFAALAEP